MPKSWGFDSGGLDMACLRGMTTKDTAKATSEAKPKEGEELVYIDHTGARIYAPSQHPKHHTKKESEK